MTQHGTVPGERINRESKTAGLPLIMRGFGLHSSGSYISPNIVTAPWRTPQSPAGTEGNSQPFQRWEGKRRFSSPVRDQRGPG